MRKQIIFVVGLLALMNNVQPKKTTHFNPKEQDFVAGLLDLVKNV